MATRQKTSAPSTSSRVYSKVTAALWLFFVGGLAVFILYLYAVSINFLNLFGELPNTRALENPKSELASVIVSADNVQLGSYFRENRTPVEYEDLPDNLVNALVATEDIRFEEHSGIDPEAMARVAASLAMGQAKGAAAR